MQGPPSGPEKPAKHWHAVDTSAPVDAVMLLAAQAVHATLPALPLYVPTAQRLQLVGSAPP